MSQVRLHSALLCALWASRLTCLGASPCEDIASLAASHIADSDAYTELQELLIRADSETAPGVSDKLTAEFQTKLSEYHAKLVASGEFNGSLDELRVKLAADARQLQQALQGKAAEETVRKNRLRTAEDDAFVEFKVVYRPDAANPNAPKDLEWIFLNSDSSKLYMANPSGLWFLNPNNPNESPKPIDLSIVDKTSGPGRPRIEHMVSTKSGDLLFILSKSGHLYRIDTTDPTHTPSQIENEGRTWRNLDRIAVSDDGLRVYQFGSNTDVILEIQVTPAGAPSRTLNFGRNFRQPKGIAAVLPDRSGSLLYVAQDEDLIQFHLKSLISIPLFNSQGGWRALALDQEGNTLAATTYRKTLQVFTVQPNLTSPYAGKISMDVFLNLDWPADKLIFDSKDSNLFIAGKDSPGFNSDVLNIVDLIAKPATKHSVDTLPTHGGNPIKEIIRNSQSEDPFLLDSTGTISQWRLKVSPILKGLQRDE